MAKGCRCVSDRMLRTERASGTRAFTLRKRWPRMDLLRPSDPRNHRAKARLCGPDSCYGVSSPTWTGFLRPFFPNQDTMPKGGLGNLIALPLQKLPRADGNSVFVDTEFRPYGDQWTFLASVKRIPVSAVEAVVLKAQRNGDLIGVRIASAEDEVQDPWTLPPSRKRDRPLPGPFPLQVQIVPANLLYIEKKDLPCAMLNRLLRLGAFQNPDFYKAQAMRLPTFNKPRVIACGEELADRIALRRGCLAQVIELLRSHRVNAVVQDERFVGRPIEVEFSGRLRPLQQDAVDAFAQHDEGILCAPTAFG